MCRIDPRIELPGILLVFLTGVSFFFFFFFLLVFLIEKETWLVIP